MADPTEGAAGLSFVDKPDENGDTALHLAAERGEMGLVKLILLYGSRAGDRNYGKFKGDTGYRG